MPTRRSNRWLGRHAVFYGMGAGMLVYLVAYISTTVLALTEPNSYDRGFVALAASFVSSGIATLVVLIAAIALMVIRRTQPFGAGMAISIAIGVLCGGGVCTALLLGTSG